MFFNYYAKIVLFYIINNALPVLYLVHTLLYTIAMHPQETLVRPLSSDAEGRGREDIEKICMLKEGACKRNFIHPKVRNFLHASIHLFEYVPYMLYNSHFSECLLTKSHLPCIFYVWIYVLLLTQHL